MSAPASLTITPRKLRGAVAVPASKSQSHRLLLAAALAEGESVLTGLTPSKDIEATLRCLEELGAEFTAQGEHLTVRGVGRSEMGPSMRRAYPRLDCGESGSTLRFLIPIALALRGGGFFRGHGRLMERPLTPYWDAFREKGICAQTQGEELFVQGALKGGDYPLAGNVSSQFVTGLLFALPLLDAPSTLTLTTPLESADYVTMTLDALKTFGVSAEKTETGYRIPAPQTYRPTCATAEGDWSQGAFWLAAEALGNDVCLSGLNQDSLQGDKAIAPMLEAMKGGGEVTLDISHCPDLVPPLAAAAALREGRTTHIVGAARLRIKESDRLQAVTAALGALGADVIEGADSLTFRGKAALRGGTADSFNDHRIAMMTAVAATACQGPVTILQPMCVEKSYPAFWADYEKTGGLIQWNT